MPNEYEISSRKPARNYRDPNDKEKRRKLATTGGTIDENHPRPPNDKKLGGSEQPGYRMKRARFWQS
ncbi:hypothetical protein [Aminobacter sp. AP02]|uniref:hypothetical protein n=1 Tax=Aminobacter sp. AP02 TaxID=2135737 RepID=UPI0011B21ACE|nr:hypothetical protein [Aminobacter sp. AP02]